MDSAQCGRIPQLAQYQLRPSHIIVQSGIYLMAIYGLCWDFQFNCYNINLLAMKLLVYISEPIVK